MPSPVSPTRFSKLSVGYLRPGSATTVAEAGADFSCIEAAVQKISIGTTGTAGLTRISSITFATGALTLGVGASSVTTFAFAGLPIGTSHPLLIVQPVSGLSAGINVGHSFASINAAGVGVFEISANSIAATLSPKVWRAVGFAF